MSDNKQAIIFNIRLRADQGFELYPGQVRFLINEAEENEALRAELDRLRGLLCTECALVAIAQEGKP